MDLKAEAEKQLWLCLKVPKHLSLVCAQQTSGVSALRKAAAVTESRQGSSWKWKWSSSSGQTGQSPCLLGCSCPPPSPWQDPGRPGSAARLLQLVFFPRVGESRIHRGESQQEGGSAVEHI